MGVRWEFSVLSAQFFCKSKTVLKIKPTKNQSSNQNCANKQKTKVWRCERAQMTGRTANIWSEDRKGGRMVDSKAVEGSGKKGLGSM